MTNHQTTSPTATAASTSAATTTAAPLLVGVGASAGGLEAFQELLAGLGDAPGVAIVFVQHFDPHTESLLPQLLVGSTSLDIVEVTKRTKLEANSLYICPPRALLEVRQGALLIVEHTDSDRPATPIDHFFRSLAESQGERGIGIILSGAGSDGRLGLKSISDCGGMTFAQEPGSAKFDSMLRSAATTGVADHVLPPAGIARELTNYVNSLSQSALRSTSISPHEKIERLERELSSTRDDLDRALREMEATNEELKSSNAELLSLNEELQSANEELATSKEEIQSALDRIARSDMDRQNLLDSTKIATLFVDDDLRIRSFTSGMTAIYNFIPSDVGRPLQHTTHTAIHMPAYPVDPTNPRVNFWPICLTRSVHR